jgi:hypothetical protein
MAWGTNSAVTVATPAPETIQEFKVQTSLHDATYGRSGGGNIRVVTRSGAINSMVQHTNTSETKR